MELEARNAQLQEELSSAPTKRPSASSPDWIPRAPARHTLTGHRSPVTRIAFHPLFNQIVSASEDATLKVWDWETGDFERTVKGHTKPVQDVDFDSKGNYVGKRVRWIKRISGQARRTLTDQMFEPPSVLLF